LPYDEAVIWTGEPFGSGAIGPNLPSVFAIRKSTIDFIATPQMDTDFIWNYYRGSMTLETNVTNAWLTYTPEWIIGEAGYRIAMDVRDQTAMGLFDDMRQRARAATFADILLDEGGPFIMGARN
jgi:hypothetical protein